MSESILPDSPSSSDEIAAAMSRIVEEQAEKIDEEHAELKRDEDPRVKFREITEAVIRPIGSPSIWWYVSLVLTLWMIIVGAISWGYQIYRGMGVTGMQHPMMWAVYITNFVWWIALAHSGTFISAILYLFRAPFRATFSRLSEAMTCVAVITAALFPMIHLGRTWRLYWVLPYPSERWIWPNFRSPLILDVFAVGTYLTVSILFFWLGLLPDLAVCRDRLRGWRRNIYGWFSMGWDGTHRQWKNYEMAYAIMACLAAPLVLSVHSCVSWDFALGLVPGWHSTMFAPYFVDGAIFQGLATVIVIAIPMRKLLHLEEYITPQRLDQLAKLVLLTGLALTWSYCSEFFMTWYKHDPSELVNLAHKMWGAPAILFWMYNFFNCIVPLAFCWKWARRNLWSLWIVGFLIIVGMWMERFIIVSVSLSRDYDPYSWFRGGYHFSAVEMGITVGSVGWFCFWMLLFCKFLPVLPMSDLKRDVLKNLRDRDAKKAARL